MSVVLATDGYETIRRVVDRLRVQTVSEELELVLVAPSRQALGQAPGEIEGFAAVQVVEVGLPLSLGEGRAAGVRAASAPLVFVGETHTYPHPRLAERLIEAHEGPWAMVVPGFGNGNPEGILSWAEFLCDYGSWAVGLPAGEITFVPPYNASFRRSVLIGFGSRLGRALSHGDEMLRGLRTGGHRAYFQPAARIDHVNVTLPAASLDQRYVGGLLVASQRRRRWSWRRSLVYSLGAPVLPVLYLSRVRAGVRAARREAQVPFGALPAMLVCTLVQAAGEMIGYAIGSSPAAERRMTEYELHREAYAVSSPR